MGKQKRKQKRKRNPRDCKEDRHQKSQQLKTFLKKHDSEPPHPHSFFEGYAGDGWVSKPPGAHLAHTVYRIKLMGRRHEP